MWDVGIMFIGIIAIKLTYFTISIKVRKLI